MMRHPARLALPALAVAGMCFLVVRSPTGPADAVTMPIAASSQAPAEPDWIAAGPGRVEPISGEIRLSASVPGRLDKIVVHVRDKVTEGMLLAIGDDREQLARVQAAEAEVSFREAERETAISSSLTNPRRSAEDSVANSQSEVWRNQMALDRLAATGARAEALEIAKASLAGSKVLLAKSQLALDALDKSNNASRPTRTESALAVARAERAIAYAVLEKTRIRAPRAGTVLNVLKLPGDAVGTAADDAVIAMGDIDRLRVRVEIDESDVANIALGQHVVVRSDAFPAKSFSGVVTFIGATARPRALAARHAIATIKDNAIQVIVGLEASPPLVPGMRVDAFFETIKTSESKGDGRGTN